MGIDGNSFLGFFSYLPEEMQIALGVLIGFLILLGVARIIL